MMQDRDWRAKLKALRLRRWRNPYPMFGLRAPEAMVMITEELLLDDLEHGDSVTRTSDP